MLYLDYELEGQVVETFLFLVFGYFITEKSFLLELLQVGDMAEWIENGLEDGPAQRQSDDDKDSHIEVICRCIVIPQVLGRV